MAALLERLLPVEPDERYDAFLAWDVFDYLRPDQVSSLMAGFRHCGSRRPGALVLLSTGRKTRLSLSVTGSWISKPSARKVPDSRRAKDRSTPSFSSRA